MGLIKPTQQFKAVKSTFQCLKNGPKIIGQQIHVSFKAISLVEVAPYKPIIIE